MIVQDLTGAHTAFWSSRASMLESWAELLELGRILGKPANVPLSISEYELMVESQSRMIVLASGSPRRRELLAISGWKFVVFPAKTSEKLILGESPLDAVARLAVEKAEAVIGLAGGRIVLAADTIVVYGAEIFGKPESIAHARQMLQALQGDKHCVITAITLIDPIKERVLVDTCSTVVPMRKLSEDEIDTYLATGSSMDKAGAYGIQDHGFHLVPLEQIEGCFTNVMGLPLCHLQSAAEALGHPFYNRLPESCSQALGYDCGLANEVLG
jgi:MAF protein